MAALRKLGVDEFVSEYEVLDNGDGSYICRYVPKVSGDVHIHVYVNGEAVKGSPFVLKVAPTVWAPLRFDHQSAEGIEWSEGGKVVSNLDSKGELRWASTRHGLPKDKTMWLRMKVTNLGEGCICITTNPNGIDGPKNRQKPWQEHHAFGWCAQKGGIIVEGGREQIEAAVWGGFNDEEELVFDV